MSDLKGLLPQSTELKFTNWTSHHIIIIVGSFSLYGLIVSCIIAGHVDKLDRWFIALTIIAYIFSLISFIYLMSYIALHHWGIKIISRHDVKPKYIVSFICLVLSTVFAISAVSLKKHVRSYDNEIMGELVNTVWFMIVFQIVFVLCALILGGHHFFDDDDE